MQTSTEGFQQAYNAQVAVDEQSQLIVAVDVGPNPADHGRLEEMLEMVAENLGALPERVLADAGYAYRADPGRSWSKGALRPTCPWAGRGAARRCSSRPHAAAWRQSFSTAEGRLIYAARKSVAEPPFGWIKHVMGLGRFSVRGLTKVQGEWALVGLALNARRLNVVAGA